MDLMQVVKRGELFLGENSTAILTAIGTVGTVTTAVLTGRASFKAAEILADPDNQMRLVPEGDAHREITKIEQLKLVWPLYIPPVGVGVATVTSIIMANRISSKKAAAMAAAYGLSEKRLEEYKAKVAEKMGVSKERAVRDDLAQDQVTRTQGSEVIITGDGEVLCLDQFTGRYFRGSKEDIKRVENLVNEQLINHVYCDMNTFYGELGLEPTSMTDELGWNIHTTGLLTIDFTSALTQDGRPCLAIDVTAPAVDYSRN